MQRVSFSITEWTNDLASRLDWVVSPSHKLTEWPVWNFCLVVQQLAWRFNFFACFTRVHCLVACQSRVPTSLHILEYFFTVSHTLSLHNSHLNIRLLSVKIQANLAQNKANKMVDKIEPYKIEGQGVCHYYQWLRILHLWFGGKLWWRREFLSIHDCCSCWVFGGLEFACVIAWGA